MRTIEQAREVIALLAEKEGELIFASEVRSGVWDHRSDVKAAMSEDFKARAIITPVEVYQVLAVKAGLKAIKMGRRVNSSYTPKNCMAMAAKLTGKSFKPRDYDGAITALEELTR